MSAPRVTHYPTGPVRGQDERPVWLVMRRLDGLDGMAGLRAARPVEECLTAAAARARCDELNTTTDATA